MSCHRCALDARPAHSSPTASSTPIHFGLSRSLARYVELRDRYPGIEIMMGTGNVSELDADTAGLNAFMLGVMSELHITHLLTTEVSPHARSVVGELDARGCSRHAKTGACRAAMMPRSGLCTNASLPYQASLFGVRDRRDPRPSYRVNVSAAGFHVYNRDGMTTATDPFDLYPRLDLLQGDAPHAFYMGVELGRAQLAWQLGKRYSNGTSPSNGAVPCVPRWTKRPRARTPRARP